MLSPSRPPCLRIMPLRAYNVMARRSGCHSRSALRNSNVSSNGFAARTFTSPPIRFIDRVRAGLSPVDKGVTSPPPSPQPGRWSLCAWSIIRSAFVSPCFVRSESSRRDEFTGRAGSRWLLNVVTTCTCTCTCTCIRIISHDGVPYFHCMEPKLVTSPGKRLQL